MAIAVDRVQIFFFLAEKFLGLYQITKNRAINQFKDRILELEELINNSDCLKLCPEVNDFKKKWQEVLPERPIMLSSIVVANSKSTTKKKKKNRN